MEEIIIPKEVDTAVKTLNNAGFKGYLVGGCTRDLLIGRKPKDWDIATDADPERIIEIFPKTFYNNKYGTVTVVDENTKDATLQNIEITPFRMESKYSDKRHPDSVTFSKNLEDDLKRRDFTINAIALDSNKGQFIDPFKGQNDIKDKILRAVGNPNERFEEDALRIMRAIRLSTELGFTLEKDTEDTLKKTALLLDKISAERIRDEVTKIIMSDNPSGGIILMEKMGILGLVIPELLQGLGIEQNEAHAYHVWEHNLRTLQHSADKNFAFHVRLAALLHDIAKPKTREWNEEKKNWTFYGHDVVGGRMSKEIMKRLKYSKETTDTVSKLVRYHLFFSDIDKITMSSVRRLLRNVGEEHIWDLMKLRACDRIGTGRPKETPYRLRKYESMIEEAMRDPISVGMLKIDGGKIMDVTREKPGPKIGFILHALLEEVLDDPKLNTGEYLEKRAVELGKLGIEELKKLGDIGKEKKDKLEEEEIKKIRDKHWVK